MFIGFLLQYQRTIDNEVLVLHVLCQADLVDGLADNTVKLAVANSNIINCVRQLGVFVAHYHNAVLRLLTRHVLHRYVAHSGVETTTANLLWFVVSINLQHGLATLTDCDVAHVDVLNDATTTRVGFDAQYTVQIW